MKLSTSISPFAVAILACLQIRSSAARGKDAAFDYVVVGGGTAGLAIASRLAETFSVAVIEAGGIYEQDNGNLSVVPAYAFTMPFLANTPDYPRNSAMDWDYVSVPQTEALNRQIHYAQGKTLGGSSALNTLAYHRGTVGAFQKWADLVGDQSYTFPNVLNYFKKSTTLSPPDFIKRATPNATFTYDASAFNTPFSGPVQVSWANYVEPTSTWLARALQMIRLPQSSEGFNSGRLSGFSSWITSSVNPRNATRSSSRTAYLDSRSLPRLSVYRNTRALKILFNRKQAIGVSVKGQEREFILKARKEVILAAGAFGSPKLLMVSGVGPKATLDQHKIPVVADLAGVGQNLWDQLFFPVLQPVKHLAPQISQADALEQYYRNQTGPLSSQGAYLAFEKIPAPLRASFTPDVVAALAFFPADWPEVEYISGGVINGAAAMSAVLVAPLSRGTVTLASADPLAQPVIDMRWFTNPADGRVAVAAVRRLREAYAKVPEILAGDELAPGPAVQSDEDILNYVRGAASQIWHPTSTCAMGRKGDPRAVVDSRGRVFGVQGLRVVDSSAHPLTVPGHPQSSVYMLAEKLADDIKRGS